MNYTNFNTTKRPYRPKAAVKQFTDLEVYQRALAGSVFANREVIASLAAVAPASRSQTARRKGKAPVDSESDYGRAIEQRIITALSRTALSIPYLIAEAHSKRFGQGTECLEILDRVMFACNRLVVCLEYARDICHTGIDTARFKEEINNYFYLRRKVLNLQRVWRKYIVENAAQEAAQNHSRRAA